ncbi:hypothetical protein LOZ39_006253 [Ophidiomyces ophidiicola]|nr:hypothetical protein LOZ64_004780 [Ophidiomyces ophidiicola]KAI2001370.1 hypothetical protein LOZ50_005714 [Ophidiomyces ophidiicola]KAI2007241.1 hypothetical protein LOZ49_004695 [Ophidiomyces ophidiicola]KAI2015710.1 hypothetical protein LOZ46_005193 [Ophidiomyces ophidiicola]KAI2063613.1 hypothetical protein LOZ40_005303 [Ophidiomyces ophidiicola]
MAPTAEPEYTVIGAWTRYSSWTARVTTILDYYGIPYKPVFGSLGETTALSHSGLVPALSARSLQNGVQVNDSLAILEFLAESHPELPFWPKDRVLRALARSAVARMHSGLCRALQTTFHTNFLGKYTGNVPVGDDALVEIKRVLALWGDLRKKTAERLRELGEEDKGFLFGEFGIADSFFWPVLWRFRTYGFPLDSASPEVLAWMKQMWSDPKMKEIQHDYYLQSKRPETVISVYDDIFKYLPGVQYTWFSEDWTFSA